MPTTPTEPTQPTEPVATTPPSPPPVEDPYLWLEEVDSEKALAWARAQNAKSEGELKADPKFNQRRDAIRAILDAKDRLITVSKRGKEYWNFWQDEKNPRGILRRTTLAEFKKKDPKWELILDIDALAAAEKENWVFAGNSCLYPTYDRCLMSLSRGGGDAHVVREFDPVKKEFVKGGFEIPEAKGSLGWIDKDTVFVSTDFGPGSMTSSGYPRIVKEWKRGTPLTAATTIFEGQPTDVSVGAGRGWDHGKTYDFVFRRSSFFAGEQYLRIDGKNVRIDIPLDADFDVWNNQAIVSLRTDWTLEGKTWPGGAMLATPLADFMAGKRNFTLLFEPAANKSLAGASGLKTGYVINELEDIKNKLYVWTVSKAGKWTKRPFTGTAKGSIGTTSIWPVENGADSDEYWMSSSDYLTPSTLSLGKLGGGAKQVKASPARFDATGLQVQQLFATSKDGTKVPYFQVSKKDMKLDGSNPTLLYGYGGFEVSLTPGYGAVSGSQWQAKGGVYVVANIRGGGEYGPAWHQAALRDKRQVAYDDFIAIAEDLIARKVTSPAKLGIQGGSNGGLLMGVMLTERPDLFGAVVCQVPLLDMKRYHKLLAGASWMEEYGNPDKPEDWAYLQKFSPYQNVKPGTKYPRTLFTSSTRDDRVHPGHARKMVARMLEQGHDVIYWENIEGGHGGAANNEQAATMQALEYTFLAKQLGLPE